MKNHEQDAAAIAVGSVIQGTPNNNRCLYQAAKRNRSTTQPKTANERLNPSETPFSHNTSKPSPYPTPLKITNDMQTPTTVFHSYVYGNESGKNKRIRYQYVYSRLNPEKLSQFEAPIEEFGSDDCLEQTDKETPHSKVNLEDSSTEKESNVCPTLSSWLQSKPGSLIQLLNTKRIRRLVGMRHHLSGD
ncbi:hypothetical protein CTI12_AA407890 [Artemisia annua]|uniref:Uncharacterized protein n=1 Tax=Artemisia annua TaxID=35608 RepID=A0A2U1M8D9_ARTAN|nr:hypothetical protein CTI12_AA407890 [Artemisia annua]